jgi:hypothetical protein
MYYYIIILFIIYVIYKSIQYTNCNEYFGNDDTNTIDNHINKINDIVEKNYEIEKYITKQNETFNDVFYKKIIMTLLLNNNYLTKPANNNYKILFITFDNRKNLEYINIHNNNLYMYCKKWNHTYIYIDNCDKNVYWCKMHLILKYLMSNTFDYVVWLDSDTYIRNFDININTILNYYSSDIFGGSDNNKDYDIINAGVFIVKNSQIGIEFINKCITYVPKICFTNDNKLLGKWAGFCYEQGIINILIHEYYYKYMTLLPRTIIMNSNKCDRNTFIMHLYFSSNNDRVKCFT